MSSSVNNLLPSYPTNCENSDLLIDMRGNTWYVFAVEGQKVYLQKVKCFADRYKILYIGKRQAKITTTCIFSDAKKPDWAFWIVKRIPKNEQVLDVIYFD